MSTTVEALIAESDRSERSVRPALSHEAISVSYLQPGKTLPLLIEPVTKAIDLIAWAKTNLSQIQAWLNLHGGILFRGFNISTTEEFESFIVAISGSLLDYSYRSTPRSLVSGKIYTSTEYPAPQSIPLHNENSYARDWPMKISFFSLRCAATGGETPIADSRRVYQRIPARIRDLFARKGVMYVRNYGSGLDLSWEEVFQTTSKPEVESYCHSFGLDFEWLPEDHLRTRQVCQAIARHPHTGEMVWFNQAQLFHLSRLTPEIREAMLTIFEEDELPRNVYYGDGTQIDGDDLDQICAAYDHEKIVFPWQQGDVLLLDNMLAAHARNPFSGERKVVVGMAQPYSETKH
ncbi:MAG: TauD/TfdA family dioxygenase [Acidobacteriota bacterium]|nr:TauD/TfdA family dioxygenase [Acidobacteriota bacterium]